MICSRCELDKLQAPFYRAQTADASWPHGEARLTALLARGSCPNMTSEAWQGQSKVRKVTTFTTKGFKNEDVLLKADKNQIRQKSI
eukprot:3877007-Amphidinium_carterae.1